MPQASLGYVGVGVESTPGTGVPPTMFIPATDVSFNAPRDNKMIREIRGSRDAYTTLLGKIEPTVSLTSKVYPNLFMGMLMHGLMGGDATNIVDDTTVTGSFKHTFNTGSPLPSLTFERSDKRTGIPPAGGSHIFQRTAGHQIESMNFTAQFGEPLTVEVTTRGTGGIVQPASKPTFSGSSYPSTAQMVNFTQAAVYIDGSGTASPLFKSIRMNFTNTFDEQETLNQSLLPYKIYEGGLECSVSADVTFEAGTAMYDKWISGAEMALMVKCEGATIPTSTAKYTVQFNFPRLLVKNFDVPMTAGEVINGSVEFDAVFDSTLNGVVEMILINGEAKTGYA